jgi:hypothetical protein
MKPRVVLCAYDVANFPDGGGHFWVYMQYALGLRRRGCDVYWLERFVPSEDPARDRAALDTFFARLGAFGFGGRVIVRRTPTAGAPSGPEWLGLEARSAEEVFRRADLLLNFEYAIDPGLLGRFRRTALVDIDPGLFQFWLSRGQLQVSPHDLYFSTGETVGRPASPIPDCGLRWIHIPPPVCLEEWPLANGPCRETMTTVSSWDSPDWIVDGDSQYENTKRVAFLEYQDLPRATRQPLELALYLRTERDQADRALMECRGWRIRCSREVAGTPAAYRDYIRGSRGEFCCAKPSCMKFRNAWVSDRTLCYLASGKPVVVQHTGESRILPNGLGMFRYRTLDEAAGALEAVNADYEGHCRAARALAEEHFGADRVAGRILEEAIG